VAYNAQFQIEGFEDLPVEVQQGLMGSLAEALSDVNYAYLINHPTPRLYKSGVRYEVPKVKGDVQPWRDVPALLAYGFGSCHELVAWLLAERRMFGDGAHVRPLVTSKFIRGKHVFHLQVQDDKGFIEDPSLMLGMGNSPWAFF
jgi:hypothetical protein